ncbi:Fe(3+) dicitrate transport ATP-binding protein FecE [Peribacillus simplex]|uniref:Fe(3+) dicitrate transport ATP-binding protein FecE n=1 Tax=Peribacillus simplex TaxID=1478 RepID=A0A9W4PEC3_9BACI|nr:Fe(3+) dicitrate transport ATP-binding protein FecE [Peribacillus simplex]
MVLHDINHASRFSHEIITMNEGAIVKIGTPGEIITPAVLEEVFRIHARVMIDPANGAPVCFGYDNLSQSKVYKEAFSSNKKKGCRQVDTLSYTFYSFSNWMISGVFCFWIPDFCNFTAVPSGKLVNIIGVTVDGAFRFMKSKSISKRGVPFVIL